MHACGLDFSVKCDFEVAALQKPLRETQPNVHNVSFY